MISRFMFLLKPFFKPLGKKISNGEALHLAKESKVPSGDLANYMIKTGTETRFLDFEELSLLDEGVHAVQQVCAINGIGEDDIEGIVYAGVLRTHYEPSMASLLANRLKLFNVRTFDINSACASAALAMELICNMLTKSQKSCFVIVSVDMPSVGIDWKIDHLPSQGVALTLGAASSALVVSRDPSHFSVRLNKFFTINNAKYAEASAALIGGYFHAFSDRLLRPLLATIPQVREIVHEFSAKKCWVLPHQPSIQISGLKDMLGSERMELEVCVTHAEFGNTGVSSWISAYQRMWEKEPAKGDGVLIYSFAAGFSSMIVAGEIV